MFLAALCTAVVPAGHSYFSLVVLAEGNRNNPLLDPGDSPCLVNTFFSPCRGGADGDLSHSCDQGSGYLVRVALGRSGVASKDPISVECHCFSRPLPASLSLTRVEWMAQLRLEGQAERKG